MTTLPDVFARRAAFRETVFQTSKEQRRTAQHTHGMARPLIEALYDRQCQGPRGLFRPKLKSVEDRSAARSPSTVCDTASEPASASTSVPKVSTLPQSNPQQPQQPQQQSPQEAQEEPVPGFLDDAGDVAMLKNKTNQREKNWHINGPCSVHNELFYFVEYLSSIRYQSAFLHHLGGDDGADDQGQRPVSSRAVSTISVAFSPNSQTMASTHGDHTVKISSTVTGRLLQSLDGHPRTPWTVKYHPRDPNIVASGCLGHQVRVWNWPEATCLQMVRLEFAIISLTFHPSGKCLAVANGTRLHFWGVGNFSGNATRMEHNATHPLSEMDQRHMLRCVHFPPDGRSLIVGGVNPTTDDPRRRSRPGIGVGGGMSFYLRLWEFNLEAALSPPRSNNNNNAAATFTLGEPSGVPRPISDPRTFVPRALLYNDGGFDVSPDGKTLCACVEYWLPDGIDSAMELVHREEELFQEKSRADENYTNFTSETSQTQEPSQACGEEGDTGTPVTMLGSNSGSSAPPPIATPKLPHRNYPEVAPRTPEPSATTAAMRLSPPPPPGRRLMPNTNSSDQQSGQSSNPADGSPPPLPPGSNTNQRPPHPLSSVTSSSYPPETRRGRYVPHVVTISLDTSPLADSILQRIGKIPIPDKSNNNTKSSIPLPAVAVGYRPRLGQLLEACPLDAGKATAVTCVKFSPSTNFCLIGYGVRELDGGQFHPVTAIYRVRPQMAQISTMLSREDDVNIARFHPSPGHGFVYGTKQGRVRVVSTRPWMFYNEQFGNEENHEGAT